MHPLSPGTKKWLLLSVACMLAAGGLYGFLLWRIKAQDGRISSFAAAISLQEKQGRILESVKRLVADSAQSREKLAQTLVPRDGAVAFIERVESLGRGAGVAPAIESVETAPLPGTGSFEELRLSVRAQGSWQDTLSFVGLLELLPVESRIDQILISQTVAGAGAGARPGDWQASVALSVLKEK